MPAIAFAHALAAHGIDTTFLGSTHGLEARLVPAANVRFEALPSQPVFGAGLAHVARLPSALLRGGVQAARRLRALAPRLVIGFGGHASVAPVLAARALGIPSALYEANVRAGLANSALAPFVDRVFVAERDVRFRVRPRALERVGHVLRAELEHEPTRLRVLPHGRPIHVLVLGGSQGSAFMNERIPGLLAALVRRGCRIEVWHQAGSAGAPASTSARYAEAAIEARVDSYLTRLSTAYQWADFAISAAGAGSIAELSALGLPSLLIPLRSVACDHQLPNALAYRARTGSLVCTQRDFDEAALATELAALLRDERRYLERVEAVTRVHQPGGSERLVARCLALADGGLYEGLPSLADSELLARSVDNACSSLASAITRPPQSAMPRSHNARR
jgi:UDP-N-acetylglucosamine--N-acetylmuramyl-(pentapeptide) pyrophosphoryl-undecaprenol N-acetylglucosamine transferase